MNFMSFFTAPVAPVAFAISSLAMVFCGGVRLLFLVGVLVCFVCVGRFAVAENTAVYMHLGTIDEVADNATDAKRLGVLKAKVAGLQSLIKSMVPASRYDDVPELPTDGIDSFVRSISFENEKFSGKRYVANLRVDYEPAQIRAFLQNSRLPFAEIQSAPLLVVPVYVRGGVPQLWENSNLWRSKWQQGLADRRQGLVPLVVPDNDFANWTVITASQAIEGERDRLDALVKKYKATGAVVIIARQNVSDSGDTKLDIDLATYAPGLEGWQTTILSDTVPNDLLMENLQIATEMATQGIEEEWKRRNLLPFDQDMSTLTATLPIASIADWKEQQNALQKTPNIRTLKIVSLTVEQAVVSVRYVGSIEQLRNALKQSGLKLHFDSAVNGWLLRNMKNDKNE